MELITKRGRQTRYGLACGNMETATSGNFSARMRMPSPSSGVILVTAQDDDWRILYNGRSIVAARRAMDDYMRVAPTM